MRWMMNFGGWRGMEGQLSVPHDDIVTCIPEPWQRGSTNRVETVYQMKYIGLMGLVVSAAGAY